MKWLNNFTLLMRSTVTALEEKVHDPERLLQQLIIDMEEELDKVRNNVAGAIADEIQLKQSATRAHAEVALWLERAGRALERGDEAQAKAALEQKLVSEQRADSLDGEYVKQKQQVQKLHDAVRDLEDKIRQARQKQTLLQARLVRAKSHQTINDALRNTTSRSAFAQFSRLEREVEREEALSQAYDRLDGRDPDAEELQREFAAKERQEQLLKELAALQQKVRSDGTP